MRQFPKGIDQVTENATNDKGSSEDLDFWDSIYFLMGYLGLNSTEFWDMQYNELMLRYESYRDQKNAAFQHDYDLARWQTFLLLQPHIDSKKGNMRYPEDLVKFEWDEKHTKVESTELSDEQKELINRMDKAVTTQQEDVFEELFTIGQKNGINRTIKH
jgi:hypothetical protein